MEFPPIPQIGLVLSLGTGAKKSVYASEQAVGRLQRAESYRNLPTMGSDKRFYIFDL